MPTLTSDPAEAALELIQTKVVLYGSYVVLLVIASVMVFLGVRYLVRFWRPF